MFKRIIITTLAAFMLLLTVIMAVSAYPVIYPDFQPASPNYIYYNGYDGIPTVAGPYPRYYIGFNDYRGTRSNFRFDDFNGYDEFVGYRDLDVYYPDKGYVDVLRNPSASISPADVDPSIPLDAKPAQVYGVLPNGGFYVKHYYHDHAWDLEGGYGYGWGDCGYFTPIVAYRTKPAYTHPCQDRSICEATHSCC
ncbi:hypothetical protein JW826_00170 [Candidatus Woesearchaeota archaeon]|nr:hypothetical protein [Candidatus Woesearchaeota archaeon]